MQGEPICPAWTRNLIICMYVFYRQQHKINRESKRWRQETFILLELKVQVPISSPVASWFHVWHLFSSVFLSVYHPPKNCVPILFWQLIPTALSCPAEIQIQNHTEGVSIVDWRCTNNKSATFSDKKKPQNLPLSVAKVRKEHAWKVSWVHAF